MPGWQYSDCCPGLVCFCGSVDLLFFLTDLLFLFTFGIVQGIDVLLGNHQFIYFLLQVVVFSVGLFLGRKKLSIFFAEFFRNRSIIPRLPKGGRM